MSSPLDRARALAVAQDFGPEALELNARLVADNPHDIASRTRLARCYLEAGRLDEAEAQYREVLSLDPRNRIAAGGIDLIEQRRHPVEEAVRRPRARSTQGVSPRAPREPVSRQPRDESGAPILEPIPQIFGGFGAEEFAELRRCPRGQVQARFAPRAIDFVRRVNVLEPSIEMAALREPGKRQLFRLGRSDVHAHPGLWHVFNYGGRWEPQVNIGMYAGAPAAGSWLRIGIGFDLADRGERGADAAGGADRARDYFHRFQDFLRSPRRSLFLGWMVREEGRIQYNHGGPRLDLREPSQAAAFILDADPLRTDWLFFGKWLRPECPDEASVLADPVALVRVVDRALAGLLPVWRTFWE